MKSISRSVEPDAPAVPAINYHCSGDLRADPLTVDAVMLFQRFRLPADLRVVDARLEALIDQHIRLCEDAILYAAKGGCYWAELPRHPIFDINIYVNRHLEECGFKLEHHEEACSKTLPDRYDKEKKVNAIDVRQYSTASWLFAKPLNSKKFRKTWKRRDALEAAAWKKHQPALRSRWDGKTLEQGDVAWASVLDGKYIVEIQEIYHRNTLCIFSLDGKCLHAEPTDVAFGAIFGADAGDVAQWEERAKKFVDALTKP